MRLRHCTPMVNLASIKRRGIDPAFSQSKLEVVWLHTLSRTEWALLHTQQRHETQDVIVIDVHVPRRWLTRRRYGLWTCDRRIEADRMSRWYECAELVMEVDS